MPNVPWHTIRPGVIPAGVAAKKLTEEQKAAILADLEAEMPATDVSHKHGIPYRSLMRLKAAGRAALAPAPARNAPAKPPLGEPRVVVVCGDVLAAARQGLEAGILYLANVAANLNPEGATPADIRSVGDGVVKVLATVVDTLEAKKRLDAPNEIACLSDVQLIEEAKRIAADRAAESKGRSN